MELARVQTLFPHIENIINCPNRLMRIISHNPQNYIILAREFGENQVNSIIFKEFREFIKIDKGRIITNNKAIMYLKISRAVVPNFVICHPYPSTWILKPEFISPILASLFMASENIRTKNSLECYLTLLISGYKVYTNTFLLMLLLNKQLRNFILEIFSSDLPIEMVIYIMHDICEFILEPKYKLQYLIDRSEMIHGSNNANIDNVWMSLNSFKYCLNDSTELIVSKGLIEEYSSYSTPFINLHLYDKYDIFPLIKKEIEDLPHELAIAIDNFLTNKTNFHLMKYIKKNVKINIGDFLSDYFVDGYPDMKFAISYILNTAISGIPNQHSIYFKGSTNYCIEHIINNISISNKYFKNIIYTEIDQHVCSMNMHISSVPTGIALYGTDIASDSISESIEFIIDTGNINSMLYLLPTLLGILGDVNINYTLDLKRKIHTQLYKLLVDCTILVTIQYFFLLTLFPYSDIFVNLVHEVLNRLVKNNNQHNLGDKINLLKNKYKL